MCKGKFVSHSSTTTQLHLKAEIVPIGFLHLKNALNFAGFFGRKGIVWLLFSVMFSLFIYLYSGSVEVHLRLQVSENIILE